jgi:hypothetical protein
MAFFICAGALSFLLAACDSTQAQNEDSDWETEPSVETMSREASTDSQLVESESEEEFDPWEPSSRMSGTWGMLLSASSKQVGIPLVKTQLMASRNYFLVEARVDGPSRIRTRETLCGLYVKLETSLNKIIVPNQFIEHAGVIERTIELDSATDGAKWISDDVYEVRGARLADPIRDPLPPSGSAKPGQRQPCDEAPWGQQCDQDQDGQPGMTNVLSGALSCKVYVTQRWHSALDGAIVDANRIEGPLSSASTEQTVLAASSALCEQVNMQTVEVIDKCPEHFYFKMVRLADDASCKDVMALTSCGKNLHACEGDETLPLNPNVDDLASCK